MSRISYLLSLAEHLPLEQGLRLGSRYKLPSNISLAEHLPLEQGLRQLYEVVIGTRLVISQSIFH